MRLQSSWIYPVRNDNEMLESCFNGKSSQRRFCQELWCVPEIFNKCHVKIVVPCYCTCDDANLDMPGDSPNNANLFGPQVFKHGGSFAKNENLD